MENIIEQENLVNQDVTFPVAYACYNKDLQTRLDSTSGGAFTTLATYFLKEKDAVIFGAAFDRNCNVKHIRVDTLDDLGRLRGSKYPQSNVCNSFLEAKAALDSGRAVFYTGTPCEIAGLKNFLGRKYENLFTMDFVCHGVGSDLVWRGYNGQFKNKGEIKKMSALLDSAVFPGVQGGPLEHVIAAKAVSFGEALQPEYIEYQTQVKKNAAAMAKAFMDKGYKIISNGTDNHCMLIDLRTKFPELTGKVAEKALVQADITVNKNMVPFDSRSPFQTSGIRVGTPAITTRGAKEEMMCEIVELIDTVLANPESETVIKAVREKVNGMMKEYPIFAY